MKSVSETTFRFKAPNSLSPAEQNGEAIVAGRSPKPCNRMDGLQPSGISTTHDSGGAMADRRSAIAAELEMQPNRDRVAIPVAERGSVR